MWLLDFISNTILAILTWSPPDYRYTDDERTWPIEKVYDPMLPTALQGKDDGMGWKRVSDGWERPVHVGLPHKSIRGQMQEHGTGVWHKKA